MGRIIFITGGARSGKSSHAVNLAESMNGKTAFIATCVGLDEEMIERIEAHKRKRPCSWKTFEEPSDIIKALDEADSCSEVIIIDCLTLWVSNLLMEGLENKDVENIAARFVEKLESINAGVIIVSNEVGMGIIPENSLARRFRDLAGRINQSLARAADEVIFMVSGIDFKIKGKE